MIIGTMVEAAQLTLGVVPAPALPEQLALFHTGDMAALKARRDRLRGARRADNTRRGYASDWSDFQSWCAEHARCSLPADPESVSLYLADLAGRRAPATLARRCSSIADAHRRASFPVPVDGAVREVVSGARRSTRRRSRAKAAVTIEELKLMVGAALATEKELLGLRDRSMLLTGFATSLRRSELVALDLADVRMLPGGRAAITVGRAKNDQLQRGRVIPLYPAVRHQDLCPVTALREYLQARGRAAGPLFLPLRPSGGQILRRLSDRMVAEIVKRCAEHAGLDPAVFAGHSLRAGCITAALDAGASDVVVSRRSGHSSPAVMGRYYRTRALGANALAAVL
jgi:site-specific recombinase XerD